VLVATLNGVINPQGMFVTPNGWLYVANTGANNILVFKKGGLNPIETLQDPNQYPVDVTVDSNGTVYASNIFDVFGNPGSVTVWRNGSTTPTAHYKIPRHILMCESFPLTVTGKVQKYKLREQAVTQLGRRGAGAATPA